MNCQVYNYNLTHCSFANAYETAFADSSALDRAANEQELKATITNKRHLDSMIEFINETTKQQQQLPGSKTARALISKCGTKADLVKRIQIHYNFQAVGEEQHSKKKRKKEAQLLIVAAALDVYSSIHNRRVLFLFSYVYGYTGILV